MISDKQLTQISKFLSLILRYEPETIGETRLIVAAICGFNDVTALFIDNGANVNEKDNDEHSALHYATEKGYNEIVEQLLMAGADS